MTSTLVRRPTMISPRGGLRPWDPRARLTLDQGTGTALAPDAPAAIVIMTLAGPPHPKVMITRVLGQRGAPGVAPAGQQGPRPRDEGTRPWASGGLQGVAPPGQQRR